MISSRVCPLIDWYQAVFNDCSIQDVFEAIKVNYLVTDDVEKVFAERFFMSVGYETSLVFNFNGVVFKLRAYDLQMLLHEHGLNDVGELDVGVFDWIFPYIQLTLSGQTLQYLRSCGIDVNGILFQPLQLSREGASYHVTRVDFAFDFVNYCPNFIDDCINQIERSKLPSGRLMTIGRSSGMCYSVRLGDQKTIYLGSGKSNKLLRIYDKKLQYQNKLGECPYNDGAEVPDSWIRLELQCRRETECHKLLYGSNGDIMKVLRYIYDEFALVESDGSKYGKERHVAEAWISLWDWETIGKIIQNANCVQSTNSFDRSLRYIRNQAFSSIVEVMSHLGVSGFCDMILSMWADLQVSNDIYHQRRALSIKARMLSYDGSLPDRVKDKKGIYILED